MIEHLVYALVAVAVVIAFAVMPLVLAKRVRRDDDDTDA
jgi:multisubunit Na+/H+ antiporter MnhC subunit